MNQTSLALSLALTVGGQAALSPQGRMELAVFIDVAKPPASADGFVDAVDVKGLNDSAIDIRKSFNNKVWKPKKGWPGSETHFTLADNATRADLIVTVAARGTSAQALGSRTTMQVYRGVAIAETVPTTGVSRWVSIVMTVGGYSKEFLAWHANQSRFALGAWGEDAELLANLVVTWAFQNEARLRERQQEARLTDTR